MTTCNDCSWCGERKDEFIPHICDPAVVAEKARNKGIKEAAKWISSSMASMMFGSDSWGLRKRLAEVVASRDWERHLKNEEMRP